MVNHGSLRSPMAMQCERVLEGEKGEGLVCRPMCLSGHSVFVITFCLCGRVGLECETFTPQPWQCCSAFGQLGPCSPDTLMIDRSKATLI